MVGFLKFFLFFLLVFLGLKKAVRWILQLAKNVVPLEPSIPGAALTGLMPSLTLVPLIQARCAG